MCSVTNTCVSCCLPSGSCDIIRIQMHYFHSCKFEQLANSYCLSSSPCTHLSTEDRRHEALLRHKSFLVLVLWGWPGVSRVPMSNKDLQKKFEGSPPSWFFAKPFFEWGLKLISSAPSRSWTKFPQQLGAHLCAYQTGPGRREDTQWNGKGGEGKTDGEWWRD